MADHGRIEGERVFCYECENEWARNEGGLRCPRCHSEFVEFRSNPPSPEPPSPQQQSPFPLRNDRVLHDHNPWEDREFPDPEEGDINTVRFNTRLGNGTISFTTRTYTSGPRGPFGNNPQDPAAREVGQDFNSLLESIMGVQPRPRPRGFDPFPPGPMGGMGFFGTPQPNQRGGRTMNDPEFTMSPFAPMFSAIFSTMNNLQPVNPGRRGSGPDAEIPPHPLMLLQHLLNPHNAAHGDAVFSQEALDRIISQLMEQNAGSNAPGPASEEAIRSLPKRPVDAEMLGSDGKAECSICMESVNIGEEVTFLPCKHWFHDQCITAWLKEHDTCPHCRQGITKSTDETEPAEPTTSPGASRQPSATPPWSPGREANRSMPGSIPQSPECEQRRDPYYERPPLPNPSTRPSRSDSNRSRNSGSGGVTGWFRNHNPFGSGSP